MLRDRFEEFAALFPEAMLLVAANGRVLTGNAAGRALLGGAGASIEGRMLAELAADAPEKVTAYLGMCARTRQMLPGTITLRCADGADPARYRVHGARLSLGSETDAGAVMLRLEAATSSPSRFALLTEKIDRLTAEIARRRTAEEALREREERLRVILTSIGDAVMVTDPAGAISFMNPVAQSVTGWCLDEARGRPLEEVFVIVNEATGETVENPVSKVLRSGNVVGLANHTVLVTRGGGLVPIDDSAAPVRKSSGELDGVVLVFREITERKQAERERERLLELEKAARLAAEQARAEAERASHTKDEFLAMLGHELRNPLAPILTALDLMRLQPEEASDEPTRLLLERQVGHMVRLVDDLLDVSRIAQGKVKLEKRRFETLDAVTQAVEMVKPSIEQLEQRLTVDVAASGLAIDGDVTRVAQVLSNLLANASKYTPRGGLITVTAGAHGKEVAIEVTDTGIGITADMLPRVFEVFAQERQAIDRSQGGLGLGLAIAHNMVKAHGGTIHAHSDGPGKGSVFTIRLPAAGAEPGQAPAEAPRTPAAGGAAGRGLRILVVDDNVDAGTLLALYLRKLGHAAHVAHDGPTALDALDHFMPEVALVDIGLPIMDGYELARRLRTRPGLEGLLLVAVTGYGQDADRRRSKDAGFDMHLVKPVARDVLKEILDGFPRERG